MLLQTVLDAVLQAQVTEFLDAGPHQHNEERQGSYRNGSDTRQLTTLRVGTIELTVPRDREGRFSTQLFERYQPNEKALVLGLVEMVVNGGSTRKVKRIIEGLCGTESQTGTISALCGRRDEQVEAWNGRHLCATTYPFVLVDAMYTKVRRQGAVRSSSLLVIVGIIAEGYREILGNRVAPSETEEGWLSTFRWLTERGLTGVERLNEEIRRREKVIRIFPNCQSARRLMGAMLMEQHELWLGRPCLKVDERWAHQAEQQGENSTDQHAPAPE